jgi:hypothetical protein
MAKARIRSPFSAIAFLCLDNGVLHCLAERHGAAIIEHIPAKRQNGFRRTFAVEH